MQRRLISKPLLATTLMIGGLLVLVIGAQCNLDANDQPLQTQRNNATVEPLVCRVSEDSSDPTKLFDGKTLNGWEGDKDLWKVVDGCIVGDSPGIKHNQFLATEKTYKDFELTLQFRLKDGVGNSGIQFRSKRVANSTEVSGYQADIGEQYWGCLYDESRRNKVLVQADKDLEKSLKKGEWNRYKIRAEGKHIRLWINDIKTVDYVEKDADIADEGVIALQVHSGPPLKIEFRDIVIRELP